MKKIIVALSFLLSTLSFNAQLLGIYEFTGTGTCPNQSPNVTLQPVGSAFDDFSMQNVFCISTQNVFNTKSWNTTSTINLSEFIQFGLHTISCNRINLDSIIFQFRNTASGNTPTWHLRSSIDDFSSDLASGISSTSTSMLADTISLNSPDFSLLADVKFRIYLTEMGTAGAAFRVDNVQVFGSETFVGTVDYFVDNDGDGYGTGAATPACVNPGGYSLNNTDCDDNNAAINPNTFWYNDADGDGFGSDLNFELGCTSTFTNPVTNGEDCDDIQITINPNTIWYEDLDNDGFGDDNLTEVACVSSLTNPVLVGGDCNDTISIVNPNTVWYQDNDSDGFGDDATTQTACTTTLTNPVLIGGDCSDIANDLHPNTVWFEDSDGDFYGNDAIFEIGCTHSFSNASLTPGDCDDGNLNLSPVAEEICDDIDNDCDGEIDENLTTSIYYIDNDADGFGSGSAGDFCSDPGINYSTNNDDCNDDDASIHPGAVDIPNNLTDEDCDGSDLTNTIDENSINNSFKVYPNPGTNNLTIKMNSSVEDFKVEIFAVDGKRVFKKNCSNNSTIDIDSESFDSGLYFVEISTKNNSSKLTWIKK